MLEVTIQLTGFFQDAYNTKPLGQQHDSTKNQTNLWNLLPLQQ